MLISPLISLTLFLVFNESIILLELPLLFSMKIDNNELLKQFKADTVFLPILLRFQ